MCVTADITVAQTEHKHKKLWENCNHGKNCMDLQNWQSCEKTALHKIKFSRGN